MYVADTVALLVANSNEDRLHISSTELMSFIPAFIVMLLLSLFWDIIQTQLCWEVVYNKQIQNITRNSCRSFASERASSGHSDSF